MAFPNLEAESERAKRYRHEALIGLDLEDFDQMPPDERLDFYKSYMSTSGFLLITTDGGQYGEAIGLSVFETTSEFLCRKNMTQRSWLTREARHFYLSENYFRIHGELLPEFLAVSNDPVRDPDGGLDPKQSIRRLNILLSLEELTEGSEDGSSSGNLLLEIISLLAQCGQQLQDIVLEVQGQTPQKRHEVLMLLNAQQREVEALDQRLQGGVLIVEYNPQLKGYRVVPLHWWDGQEEKLHKMREAEREYRARFPESEQLDYDDEDDNGNGGDSVY